SLPNERYRPSYFFKTRPLIMGAPGATAYGATFNVSTDHPAAIDKAVFMRQGAVTHAFNQAQRAIDSVIAGTAGSGVRLVAPPHGLLAPPGWYLLFLVDQDRVPSEGVWIKLSEGRTIARRAIFKIPPAFGIARVGDSADGWFIGPELRGVPPLPEAGRGGEGFRAAGIKRQGARFRVYEYEVDEHGQLGPWRELTLDDPAIKSIEWTVHLANTN